jgi:xylan 1,4-beta-xylosidase
MKILLSALFLVLASSALAAEPSAGAVFSYVSFSGSDSIDAAAPLKPAEVRNPVLPGFHPDPSIVRVGKDYYLVNSSFSFYPGLPIFHSRDLLRWTQIGNAIDRPEMFDFTGLGIARAVFAPTIRYHRGLFYIVNTCIECGFNFLITARSPAGPWSEPVFLPPVDGIDPDLFIDEDGRAWISNNGPPIGMPRYDGHRAIWIQEFDLKTQKMTGPRTLLVNGGVHFADKPIWTEGPHIFKRDSYYYLIAAEGGTAGNHSETVYRSRKVTGPYTPGPINPILTQRDLDPARPFPVYAAGHADFVQAPDGKWWSVFLGTRPYKANLSNLGRETFLLPVSWPKDGWPLILSKGKVVRQVVAGRQTKTVTSNHNDISDDFTAPKLSPDWLMLRTPTVSWYSLAPHALTLTPRTETLSGIGNPSFLAKRQRHSEEMVETEMRYTPTREGDQAGLAIFADEHHHFFFGVRQMAQGPTLVVSKRNGAVDPDEGRIIATAPIKPGLALRLRISSFGPTLNFTYAYPDGHLQPLLLTADGQILASEASNQFTGTVIGPYASRRR